MFVIVVYHKRNSTRVIGPFKSWAEAELFERNIAANTTIVECEQVSNNS